MLTFRKVGVGLQEAHLDLRDLYPTADEYSHFRSRLARFLLADPAHAEIFEWEGHSLIYRTECLIPEKEDEREPLLLLFGNPASHSVSSGMFFSYEGAAREHRFWRALRAAGLLTFRSDCDRQGIIDEQLRSALRKEELYSLEYASLFRIGLAVFFSIPSPASATPWCGVAGVRKLFGLRALREIAVCEKARLCRLIRSFLSSRGAIVAFQKDAYQNTASSDSPSYRLAQAKSGALSGRCECDRGVPVFGFPPTRMLHEKQTIRLLVDLQTRFSPERRPSGHASA